MRFSFVVPAYNSEKYIHACIDSILLQKGEYEVVIVDDGSTDKTCQICQNYVAQGLVKYFFQENSGQIAARSKGLLESSGEYIIFVDSDDLIENDFLETIDKYISIYQVDCVIIGFKKLSCELNAKSRDFSNPKPLFIDNKRSLLNIVLNDESFNSLPRKIVRREFIDTSFTKLHKKIRMGEDLIQSLFIYEACKKFLLIYEELYIYRDNTESITYRQLKNYSAIDFLTVREETFSFLNSLNVFSEEDFKNYRTFVVRLFIREIRKIAKLNCSFTEKKRIYRFLRKSSLYRDYLKNKSFSAKKVGFRVLMYYLYLLHFYSATILIFKLFDCRHHAK